MTTKDRLVEQRVTYTLLKEDKFYVNEETGEQFFSPQTVERLLHIILGERQPVWVIETPVFEFA